MSDGLEEGGRERPAAGTGRARGGLDGGLRCARTHADAPAKGASRGLSNGEGVRLGADGGSQAAGGAWPRCSLRAGSERDGCASAGSKAGADAARAVVAATRGSRAGRGAAAAERSATGLPAGRTLARRCLAGLSSAASSSGVPPPPLRSAEALSRVPEGTCQWPNPCGRAPWTDASVQCMVENSRHSRANSTNTARRVGASADGVFLSLDGWQGGCAKNRSPGCLAGQGPCGKVGRIMSCVENNSQDHSRAGDQGRIPRRHGVLSVGPCRD